jgi:hypothetical protein
MKKFSNQNIKEELLKTQLPKLNQTILNAIEDNIMLSSNNENMNNVEILGKDELVEKIINFIEEKRKEKKIILQETLKYKYVNNINLPEINEHINNLSKLCVEVTPAPEDIFNREDYIKENDSIILEKINNIPLSYIDFINNQNAKDYINEGNKIKIEKLKNGWGLQFIPNIINYGTELDNYMARYEKFIKENKDFISDFIDASVQIVGKDKIKLENKLINIFK